MAGVKGRSGPPKHFDKDELRKICALHPTHEELAAYMKCSADTIERRLKNDPEFSKAFYEGRGTGRLSLRRKQWAAAMDGNIAMLIWMGKQHLGQRDAPPEHDPEVERALLDVYRGIDFQGIAPSMLPFVRNVKTDAYTHYWAKGGRGSTKSCTIAKLIVDGIISDPGSHAVVIRQTKASIDESAYSTIQWAADELGIADKFKFRQNPLDMTYTPTCQKILFRGLDDPIKIKSLKMRFGYVRWIWYEEASEIRGGLETIRNVNQSLMRGGDKFSVFYSYNPPKSKNNWINLAADEQIGRADSYVHTSDYLTVPQDWLGTQFIHEAEALKEANIKAYEHEYLGAVTGTGGDVFDNVVVEQIPDSVIAGLKVVRRGIDFGFSVDPAVYLASAYSQLYDTLYIFSEIYQTGLHNDQLARLIFEKGVTRADYIYCDSASPQNISDLQREGLNTLGATKGRDLIEIGYKYLQRWKRIVIDPARCPNAKREFVNHQYEQDRHGNFLAQVSGRDNHCVSEGQLVETSNGALPIEEIKSGDYVLTRKGYRKVLRAWCSGRNREVVKIKTGGHELICTPCHKVYTENRGFIRADELATGDTMATWSEEWLKQLNMAGINTDAILKAQGWQTVDISRESAIKTAKSVEFTSIGRFGKMPTGQFLKDAIFTILMAIQEIMTCLTLNALPQVNTCPAISVISQMSKRPLERPILTQYAPLQRHGMLLKKVGKSIKSLAELLGINSYQSKEHASNAGHLSCQGFSENKINIARMLVNLPFVALQALMMKLGFVPNAQKSSRLINMQSMSCVRDHVETVEHGGFAERVYDLTVEGEHEFFAGSLLVHNCIDSLRYSHDQEIRAIRPAVIGHASTVARGNAYVG